MTEVSQQTLDRVAWSGELEFLGATEDDHTGRTVNFRIIRKLDELGEAHPFGTFTRRRRGHAGTRFETVLAPVGGGPNIALEAMLLNWADGPKGATVKFLLNPEQHEEHPFMGCTRRSREAGGTSFMAVLLELDDDNTIVNQGKRQRYEGAQQKLSNAAAILLKSPRFHEWANEVYLKQTEVSTDEWLKSLLNIKSKAELDRNTTAAKSFRNMRALYTEWLHAKGFDRD